jgi:hypothetical protein
MIEAEEVEQTQIYEFVATGENTCERCAALDGSQWQEPPNPPHAHCECEVKVRPAGLHEPRECGESHWSIEHLAPPNPTVRYTSDGAAYPDSFEWGFMVTVSCWDGLEYEFEIWVDMGIQDDYGDLMSDTDGAYEAMEAYAWSEIYDEAEAVLARVCRPCAPELVS